MIKTILHLSYKNPMRKSNLRNQSTRMWSVMTTSANMHTPSTLITMSIRLHEFTFRKHEIMHFSQWSQKHLAQHHARSFFLHHGCNKKMDPHKIKGWLQMQCDTPKTKRWKCFTCDFQLILKFNLLSLGNI